MPDQDQSFGGFGPLGAQTDWAHATPEQAAQLRALANSQMTQQPEAKSWAGVLGNVAQTWAGMQNMQRAADTQAAGLRYGQQVQSGIGQGGAGGGGGLLGGQPPNGAGGGSDPVSALAPAIAKQETGGAANPYTVDGPRSKSGDYPSGKYQVMGANIPSWTQEATGQPLTRAQFKASPQAQEAVFHTKMGQYYQQTGNPADAASMWISGKPLAQALAGGNRPDVNGTTPAAYSSAVVNALRGGGGGGQQMAQASPITGMTNQQYGAVMSAPYVSQDQKNRYQEMNTPQTRVGATGQIIPFTPGQQQGGGGELAPGYVQSGFGVPGFQGQAGAVTRGGQPGNWQGNVPPLNGQGGNTGDNINAWATYGRGLQGQSDTQGNNIGILKDYTVQGGESNRMLGALGNLEEAGKHVAQQGWQKYFPPQLLAKASAYGIPVDEDGSITGFKVAAMQALGTGPEWEGLREQIPNLNNTPQAREAIVQQIRSMHQYVAQRGNAARGLGSDGKPDPALNTGDAGVYQKRLDAAQRTQMQTPAGNAPTNPKYPSPAAGGGGATQPATATAPVVRKWQRQPDGSMGLSQ